MIRHFLEVWFLFLAVFTLGCWLGAGLYAGLARGRLAAAQGVVADAIGDTIDEIKWRLGVAPDWRPSLRPPVVRPLPRSAMRAPPAEDDGRRSIAPAPPSWADETLEPHEAWPDDADWEEAGDEAAPGEADYAAELKAAAAEELAAREPVPEDSTMMRPAGLAAPRSGVPDNLQRIRGIGKRNEERLHALGIFHFGQIAAWTPAEMRWVAAHLAFPERIERDDWIGQAIVLASGGDPDAGKPAERRKKSADEDDD